MTDRADTHPGPRDRILDAALRIAPFEGWSRRTLLRAARDAGLTQGAADLYFPDGELGLIRYWHQRTLAALEAGIATRGLANMRIRDRVREGVLLAMETIGADETALRRAMSRMSLPDAAGQAPRQAWEVADTIWRGIGDSSTDFNYYTKRAILAGVVTSTLVAWLGDADPDKASARAHLDRRLDNVLQFEKVKARARQVRSVLPNPAEALGRLRYGLSGAGGMPGLRSPSTKSRRRRSR